MKNNIFFAISEMKSQSHRLLQIFWVTQLTIVIISLQRIMGQYWEDIAILGALSVSLIPVYFFAKRNTPVLGSNYLATILTLVMIYFMWPHEGARDEVLLVFPAIFIFSILGGNIITSFILLAIVVINVLLMGYLQQFQLFEFAPANNSLNASTLITILIGISSFAIWLMARDLKQALNDLKLENSRVLKSREEINNLVNFDVLTGLPNRTLAKIRFDFVFEQSLHDSSSLCLMFIDLDDFKHVNDSLGHSNGDKFLTIIASRLNSTIRDSDTLCRLGGDEFLVITSNIHSSANAQKMGQSLLDCVQAPIELDGNKLVTTCSIGIAIAPEDGNTFEELCQRADMAMYKGKEKGKNEANFFNPDWMQSHNQLLALTSDLRVALNKNQLEVYYQPKVLLHNGALIGAEALLRWNHPTMGFVSPDVFIPLAEKSGQIVEIGKWVIEQACENLLLWRKIHASFTIAVNVSSIQFKRGDLSEHVKNTLKKYHLPGQSLELEFTESLLMDNTLEVASELQSIKKLNVSLAIDDFGTGYSNLGYLQNFEIQTLKMDRSFIHNIYENKKNIAIVKAIIQMAHSLEILVVAEGIEDEKTAKIIEKLGCTIGQGYFWQKPVPADTLNALIQLNNVNGQNITFKEPVRV
jgi:diguanylate cyclase (GGDEF)-like protein